MLDRHTWLFDMDGTLVLTEPLHAAAFDKLLEEMLPAKRASFDYARFRGMTTLDVGRALGVEGTQLKVFNDRKRALYQELLAQAPDVLAPGARALLQWLHAQGRQSYLVTGASKSSVESIFDKTRISGYFEGCIHAEDVTHGKPNPEPYLLCIKRFGLSARDCIAVEDSPAGVNSAKAAHLFTLGVGPHAQGAADRQFESLQSIVNEIKIPSER